MEKSYLPNVYISAVLFKGSGGGGINLQGGIRPLNVSVADKKLDIALKPDKLATSPASNLPTRSRPPTRRGRGVPAEVSLAVVDASVLALAYDNSLTS